MKQKVLIIGHRWVEPKASAAGRRMMQLIQCWRDDGHTVIFACASAKTDNAEDLQSLGVEEMSILLNDDSFDEMISEMQPDVVVYDRYMTEEQFGWRVSECCPEAMTILDTEDLHCLRKGRQLAVKAEESFSQEHLYNDVAKREIASIYRCDLTLVISEVEMEILQSDFGVPESLICYVPFLGSPITEQEQKSLPSFGERKHFVTIGNFLHEPNYDGVRYLKQHIWPLIRERHPRAEMHVYGAYVPEKAKQLHNEKDGFLIKGYAPDVDQVMRAARVCLVALRYGAGLKGKIIDAMRSGTPCVMTSIGAEGMFGELPANGFVSDDPEEFANRAAALLEDQTLWTTMQQNGYSCHEQRFGYVSGRSNFVHRCSEIRAELYEHRQRNFTGQMLRHHTLQSTKYLSKWITEKNKNSEATQ